MYICTQKKTRGAGNPSFYLLWFFEMGVEEQIKTWLDEWLAERPDLFPVKVQLNGKKLLVLIDGDEGINIGDCAKISRFLGQKFEENDIIDNAFTLEVSSPGADEPFVNYRQYKKNIGRTLHIKHNDAHFTEGKLLEVFDDKISIEQTIKEKGKKSYTEIIPVKLDDIMETKIILSFK